MKCPECNNEMTCKERTSFEEAFGQAGADGYYVPRTTSTYACAACKIRCVDDGDEPIWSVPKALRPTPAQLVVLAKMDNYYSANVLRTAVTKKAASAVINKSTVMAAFDEDRPSGRRYWDRDDGFDDYGSLIEFGDYMDGHGDH